MIKELLVKLKVDKTFINTGPCGMPLKIPMEKILKDTNDLLMMPKFSVYLTLERVERILA